MFIADVCNYDDVTTVGKGERIDLDLEKWRIPLYLLCSASALAQYRYPIVDYWRGLAVQLVAYEVQYQSAKAFSQLHDTDNMDLAFANVAGAFAAVISAWVLAVVIEFFKKRYYNRILQREDGTKSRFDKCLYGCMTGLVYLGGWLHLNRKSDVTKARMLEPKLKAFKTADVSADVVGNITKKIELNEEEEAAFVETLVGSQTMNIWAMLMPAIYQLVPGAMVARMWFTSLFPPIQVKETTTVFAMVNGTEIATNISTYALEEGTSNVFSNLMVISTSLAIGVILGFAVLHFIVTSILSCSCVREKPDANDAKGTLAELNEAVRKEKRWKGELDRLVGMFTSTHRDDDNDDASDHNARGEDTAVDSGSGDGDQNDHQSPETRAERSHSLLLSSPRQQLSAAAEVSASGESDSVLGALTQIESHDDAGSKPAPAHDEQPRAGRPTVMDIDWGAGQPKAKIAGSRSTPSTSSAAGRKIHTQTSLV